MLHRVRITMPFTLVAALLLVFPTLLTSRNSAAATPSSNSGEPTLIAEVRDMSAASQGTAPAAAVAMTFCLAYGGPSFSPGSPPIPIPANTFIGCQQVFPPGQTGYFDFDTSNTPNFSNVLSPLTNGVDEVIWTCAVTLDSNGLVTVPAGCAGGMESDRIEGINRSSDLIGKNIDFVRLVVNKVVVSSDGTGNSAEWDVVWQFWSGTQFASGGGQRSDVDDFLLYANPLQEHTTLSASATGFNVTVLYGTTINAATFEATLNGAIFGGFHPVAGTRETVSVPLTRGRNTLTLKIDGLRSDGRTATDRDRLTFLVP